MINKAANTQINSYLDGLIRPKIHIGQRPHLAFQVCGYTGLMFAVLLEVPLVAYFGLSQIVMAGIVTAALATFLVLAMTTKIIIGEERLIYYHHEIAIMLVATTVLWLLNQPILVYLDITILAIGSFLTCGRIGCLMVGCCHGRPNPFGVCYHEAHVRAGFTPYYMGVRLFPIQAVESLWVLGIVLVGISLLLLDYPPGTAVTWYVIIYDLGRFFFEFLRGDPKRLYWKGFSEGQWTSVLLMVVVIGLGLFDRLPYTAWHLGATLLVILIMISIALVRLLKKTNEHQLNNPRHVRELAEVLEDLSNLVDTNQNSLSGNIIPENIIVRSTSLGILISADHLIDPGCGRQHYAISLKEGKMNGDIAKKIKEIISTIKPSQYTWEIIKGKHGIYHFIGIRGQIFKIDKF